MLPVSKVTTARFAKNQRASSLHVPHSPNCQDATVWAHPDRKNTLKATSSLDKADPPPPTPRRPRARPDTRTPALEYGLGRSL